MDFNTTVFRTAFTRGVADDRIQFALATDIDNVRVYTLADEVVSNGLGASEAAYNVGYNNPSQFSREFKRQFGLPPSRAAEIL